MYFWHMQSYFRMHIQANNIDVMLVRVIELVTGIVKFKFWTYSLLLDSFIQLRYFNLAIANTVNEFQVKINV